jgi:hypothetical protein
MAVKAAHITAQNTAGTPARRTCTAAPRQRRSQPCVGEDHGEQPPGRQRRDHHDWVP